MKILITGDLAINKLYDISNIDPKLIDLFQKSDYNITNLESPVTKCNTKIIKTGPHLKANRESTLKILKSLKMDLVTLANNHILDYGEQGVLDTINFCQKNKICTVGAGKNVKEASKIFYVHSPEGKIAIINIAENEWASASETTAGANGMDFIDDVKKIQEAKDQSDFVFVIVHGGHLFYNLPSPRMQKQYRFYVDNGADLVVGHHTHCISGMETYRNKPIYYGLGNFIFTKPFKQSNSNKGLILEIKLTNSHDTRVIKHRVFPISIRKESFSTYLPDIQEEKAIQEEIEKYNLIISSPSELQSHWEKYVLKSETLILNNITLLSGIKNKYLKAVLRKLKIHMLNKKYTASLYNHLNCESHLNLTKEVLRNNIGNKK